MKIDIIIVTYNSTKWLDRLIHSIENQKEFDLKDINLIFVDNVSKDDTIKKLKDYKSKTSLGGFEIIESKKNLGFGKGNNLGSKYAKSDYLFFLNPDTELEEYSLKNAFEEINNSNEEFKMWELRQKPYEHPKYYDILTGETSWASGACFIIEKNAYNKIEGFDKKIFMYGEDVDISWKVRLYGYKIKYMPKASIIHYCYEEAGQIKPTQYCYSIINNLNLRRKYGNLINIFGWYKRFAKILLRKGPFLNSRTLLVKKFLYNIKNYLYFKTWRFKDNRINLLKKFQPTFYDFDYESNRLGAFADTSKVDSKPLVSIIVRTCGRPTVLRETLQSIRKQTYSNIEIVIIEDGKNISEEMIKNEFSDLNIIYKFTGNNVGRCVAGNIGLETANGKYLNFLDDDDLFFADHVENMVNSLEKNPDYKLAYSVAYESKIEIETKEPEYKYKEYERNIVHNKEFSRITLLTRNAFPIQTVMFNKEIFLKYGGFDTELEYLEDWELWARYSLENKFLYVPKLMSLYRVPYYKENFEKRQEIFDDYYKKARKKIWDRKIIMQPEDLLEEVKYI